MYCFCTAEQAQFARNSPCKVSAYEEDQRYERQLELTSDGGNRITFWFSWKQGDQTYELVCPLTAVLRQMAFN